MSTEQNGCTVLVIVDSGDVVINQSSFDGIGDAPAVVLSFTQSKAKVEEVVAAVSSSSDVRIESGAPSVDDVAPDVTERFLELLARVPREFKLGGKPLDQAWEFDGGGSLWWLHELSGRRSDLYPTFTRLCQLEVVRRAVQRSGATDVVLVSDDGAFSKVIASLCEGLAITYSAPPAAKANTGLSYRGIVARLALWSSRTVAQTLLAKLLTFNTKPVRVSGMPVCCFHTLYPALFITTHGVMDEKFHRVPNLVASHGVTPFLAVTFAADDGHQHLTMPAYVKACLMLRRKPSFNDVPAGLIDRDLSWGGMVSGRVGGAVAAFRNASLEWRRGFRSLWRMGDVDIFPLIRPELRMATYRTPRYLMHLRRMQAFVDATEPDAVTSSLFEFCYGRATTYAIAGSRSKPLNIGVQHGPTGRKLMYRFAAGELAASAEARSPLHVPMPDHLILESEEARIALSTSGYPSERLHVLGAPRLDSLPGVPRWRGAKGRKGKPGRVLVAFGASDGAQIMGMVSPVMERIGGYHFIMKPHPRSSVQAEQIEAILSHGRASTYEVASVGLYDLLPTAEVVVATYSSVGMEAAALGYPTVVLNLPDFASPSGLMDIAGNVRFAASPEALATVLEAAASTAVAESGEVERAFFSRLDGKAQERWAEAIARLTLGRV